MMNQKLETAEAAINEILGRLPRPPEAQEFDHHENFVGNQPLPTNSRAFNHIFSPLAHPDIFEALRGSVILMIDETHVRLFEDLGSALTFGEDLRSSRKIIPGPTKSDLSLKELENP